MDFKKSEAIGTDQLVALMAAKVTIGTIWWKSITETSIDTNSCSLMII